MKKTRTKHSPGLQGEGCLGGATRAGDGSGASASSPGSRKSDLQVEATSFWRTSLGRSIPRRTEEAMRRPANRNCFRRSES